MVLAATSWFLLMPEGCREVHVGLIERRIMFVNTVLILRGRKSRADRGMYERIALSMYIITET